MKYRPSVERAALLKEMIAVPAEPEKPEMNSAIENRREYKGRLFEKFNCTRFQVD